MSGQFIKIPNTKFQENPSVEFALFHEKTQRGDGGTDMNRLVISFRNYLQALRQIAAHRQAAVHLIHELNFIVSQTQQFVLG